MADEAAFMAQLPEPDRLAFRNLALLRPQLPTEAQLELVESLARTLDSPRLLTLIARTPHWLASGPVLQALAGNEATPELLRRDLEMAVALFDLMRDLDQAAPGEKEERAETVKDLYHQLPLGLRAVVKQQAKQLARTAHPTGLTRELPPLPDAHPDWEALTAPPGEPLSRSRKDLLDRAAAAIRPDDLQDGLLDPDSGVRTTILRNPALAEEVLVRALPLAPGPELFEETYAEARWYFRDPVRTAILASPACPRELARKMTVARDLVALLEQGGRQARTLRRMVSLFTQLDETEYQYLTFWAKQHAPDLLRVVKIFYNRLRRRLTDQAEGVPPSRRPGALQSRVLQANQAAQPDQLMAALEDPDASVFRAALENPALTQRELIAVLPGLDGPRVEAVARHRSWNTSPDVAAALVHHPRLQEATALRLLLRVRTPRALLEVLRDSRLPHLEVKRLALERLHDVYRAMAVPQRVQALQSSGGELLRHLAQEILADGATLRELLADPGADPGILLRLARNRQTPREVLALIAAHPILPAHPPILSELLLNPKTPRQAAARIWDLLPGRDQQVLLRSPHLPASLRHL